MNLAHYVVVSVVLEDRRVLGVARANGGSKRRGGGPKVVQAGGA